VLFRSINIINNLVDQIFVGIRASFGNLIVKETVDDAHKMFNVMYFLNFWVVAFCSVCLVVLLNPFISIWLGEDTVFPLSVVVIIVANFYFRGMTAAIEVVRNGAGLYNPYPFFKYWALLEGAVNLLIAITLIGPVSMGIYGVFLATTISTQITVYVLPWNVYKYVFKRSSRSYYKKNFLYLICTALLTFGTYSLCQLISINGSVLLLLMKAIISIIVPNLVIIVFFHKTYEFQYLWHMIKNFIGKRLIVNRKNIKGDEMPSSQ
jgi:hypothetical protein